jgi:hypothetical protein
MFLRIDLSLSGFLYDHHQMGVRPRTPPATECTRLGFLSFRASKCSPRLFFSVQSVCSSRRLPMDFDASGRDFPPVVIPLVMSAGMVNHVLGRAGAG